jgi:hypothetical protein
VIYSVVYVYACVCGIYVRVGPVTDISETVICTNAKYIVGQEQEWMQSVSKYKIL